ncbi:MAG: signal recognition particle protein [Nitrospirae bacterium]|nr:MAG: signal recognition particle protein [Nitrospirota bacterium]
MLNVLSAKLEGIFKRLRGQGVLSEANVAEALKEVRLALLEADVNFKIVKDFVERVRVKAVGQEVLQSLSPGHQVVKVVWDELVALMGPLQTGIALSSMPPTVIMMVGLQGVGKTTTSGKLARYFKGAGKRVLLVAADPRRPAAVEQLVILGQSLNIPVYRAENPSADAVSTCEHGVDQARAQGYDVVILDTGGRLHIDDDLMKELIAIKTRTSPHEILLVADAMIGQDAVEMAEQFNREIGVTGIILTKVEGDARGGAILSIKAVTGKPIKFLGTGEKLDALEPFHPDRMASRILGMGDVLSLIEKAQEAVDQDQAQAMVQKLQSDGLTLADFREQLKQVNKLGSLDQILDMLPGGQRLKDMAGAGLPEKELAKTAAIIDSMTPKERLDHTLLNGSRKKRIAKGSGTSAQDVNRLIKQFLEARKMMKALSGRGGRKWLGKPNRALLS